MKIFGILNVTPDSFSDGGNYSNTELAKLRVEQMIKDGASIIDVGGESTRPGASFVTAAEEINRVIPIIEMISANFDVEISIDTYKSEVANAAVAAGASIINDVQANQYDGKMLEIVKKNDVKYIAMHSRKNNNVMLDMEIVFIQILNFAKELEIPNSNIILDPGIGFNKDLNDNLKILKSLKSLKAKFPTNQFLLGTSRKRFIGLINNVEVAKERVIGTTVTTVIAYQAGFEYVRVHDVLANKHAIEMIGAIENHE